MRQYLTEIIGTFILTLAVIFSINGSLPLPTPVIAGLAVGLGVYSLGGISGAHFNPAITLAVLAVQKITTHNAILYISSQLIGAAAATEVARRVLEIKPMGAGESTMILFAEMLGAFVFALGVGAVVHGKVTQGASGLAIGGSLLLGICLASVGSNGVLNPAVALGIGSFSYSYLLGPIVGAPLAMVLYKHLVK